MGTVMDSLQFECSDVFGLAGRGVVFRGYVLSGVISVGERLQFKTRDGMRSANVAAIELERKLIGASVKGKEIGLLLDSFDAPQVNAAIQAAFDPELANNLESPETLLKITLPVILVTSGQL